MSISIPQVRSSTTFRVPLLPNGSEIHLKNEYVVMKHTCSFDSLVSVFGAIFIDIAVMRDKFDSSTSKFANFIKSLLHRKFDKEMEIARYELLKEVHPDKKALKKVGKLTSFYCDVSIGGFFTGMHTSNADVMSSRKRHKNVLHADTKILLTRRLSITLGNLISNMFRNLLSAKEFEYAKRAQKKL